MSYSNGPKSITNGLVLYLDAANPKSYIGSGTTWNDLSGNNNSGSLINGPAFNTGSKGSIVFDGSDDYVTISNSTTISTFTEMTLEVVVKYNNLSDQIFAQKYNYNTNGGYGIEIFQNNIAAYCVSSIGGGYVSTAVSAFSSGKIHVFVLSFSGNTQYLYANGIFVKSSGNGNVTSTTENDFRIGGRSNSAGGNGSKLSGNVYSVKLYNRALSSQEILQNYNSTKGRFGL